MALDTKSRWRRLAAKRSGKRSPEWWAFEEKYLAAHPHCDACQEGFRGGACQAHHIIPYHYVVALGRPDLEFDERNLMTLCETEKKADPAPNHHLLIGHLGNFRSGNPWARDDAALFRGLSAVELKADKRWLFRQSRRLATLDMLRQSDRVLMRAMLDERFPLVPELAKAA